MNGCGRHSSNDHSINRFIQYGREKNWWRTGRTFIHLCNNQLFRNTVLDDKSVLDIGAGKGLYSLWAALNGARKVVALEPSLAGSRNVYSNRDMIEAMRFLGVNNIELFPVSFQDYDVAMEKFDVILLKDSINHLSEHACVELQHNINARDEYLAIFRKIRNLMMPDGIVIITDCSNRNFFFDLKLYNPMAPTIDWDKHQFPTLWKELLYQSGFKKVKIDWLSPSYLFMMHYVLDNALASYFTNSKFRIEARI